MSKAKVNKSAIIRKLHDEGKTVKEIKAKTKYSDPLIRVVLRNYEKKTRKFKVTRKDLLNEIKPAINELFGDKAEKKPYMKAAFENPVMINLARRKDGAIIDLNKGGKVISPPDLVNRPPHYRDGGIDFLDYAEAKGLTENAYLFNVVKYVSRAGKKVGANPVEDLKKAQFYLSREIAIRERA